MGLTNYIIAILILLGAFILFLSARYTTKIFRILPDNKLKSNWKKLRLLMILFLVGYLGVALAVILGNTNLLTYLSGGIFFMGSLFVFIVVGTGLDSFKKLNELHQNLDDTELKNKELEQFVYITSHDLKAPLRGISSLTTFAKEDLEAGNTASLLNHLILMEGRIERLEDLINGILHYSKIGKIKVERLDLHALVEDEFKNYKNQKHIHFKIIGRLPIIKGDKTQISQVIANLISNAIKYNDKEFCQVTIASLERSDYYEISFEDNGPGIAPQYHEKIFNVFQTLTEDQTLESTGLGLSIVKKIIEKHEGRIHLHSDGELGSKFILSYPKRLSR
ncbi:sensor histidine kinase [Croceivirga sp. JEA036]|uniref:sensor histidine kinase n=1 Tax=Croceivirga sp. JEA036 TaxID=2721162 RepID=UPI00143901BE|nr:ATP-binding protein [Croceivirga sp. JEA036]NJB36453.1 sensor histidine kinase [Croceivirga sp. JEA036]